MTEYVLYGISFFVCTLFVQYLANKIRKDKNKGNYPVWSGSSAIIIICGTGIAFGKISYLAAVIGFAIADEIGRITGWHK